MESLDLTDFKSTFTGLEDIKDGFKLLEMFFEYAVAGGAFIVDTKGVIKYANRKFLDFYNLTKEDAKGTPIGQITKEDGMMRVIRTGKIEVGDIIEKGNIKVVINRIPLKENGKVIGAIGIGLFKDINALKELYKKIEVLEAKLEFYQTKFDSIYSAHYTFKNIIGQSPKIMATKKLAFKAAQTTSPIIIHGESGTGKELFAHSIHMASPRSKKDFICVNCSAIPKDLVESELFGYEAGAFTGAERRGKPGKFEIAHRGTIFLDEIGDMPAEMQAKILRVLQEKVIERVGGRKPIKVDFRLITATNKDISKLLDLGQFRSDLLYRLRVIEIKIPPLRERREDIPLLVDYFLDRATKERGIKKIDITKKALDFLKNYNFPGNVRELLNIIEGTIDLIDKDTI
ncbi:MAG: sigma 54-interacting transcriptional regulator, partial [Thermodesulfobacteriota bacterium]|nr:sigma 54-interacting transcriptional regulator [Thermodesulfobacteriota bacterium]